MQYVILIGFMLVTITGIGAGAWQSMNGMSRSASATWRVEQDFSDESRDIQRHYRDSRNGMIDAVVGTGRAAMAAQSAASPGVSNAPLGVGFSDAMSVGAMAAGAADEVVSNAESGTPTDTSADDEGAGSSIGGTAVPVADAPDGHFMAWYAINWEGQPVFVTTVGEFRRQEADGDANDLGELSDLYNWNPSLPAPARAKVGFTDAYPARAQALAAASEIITGERQGSIRGRSVPIGEFMGETMNLEFLETEAWWE